MKIGQAHQLDERAAKELEERIVRLNRTGYAIKSLYNVLVEIDIVENTDNFDFCVLEAYEKHHIHDAMMLLGELTTKETYKLAERFGLKNPC